MNDIYATTSPQNQQWDEIISRLALNNISKQYLVHLNIIIFSNHISFLRRQWLSEVFIIFFFFFPKKDYEKLPETAATGFQRFLDNLSLTDHTVFFQKILNPVVV